jgi:hypothetical protein
MAQLEGLENLRPGATITHQGNVIGTVHSVSIGRGHHGSQQGNIEIFYHPSMKSPTASSAVKAVFGVPGWKKPYRGNLVGNIKIRYRTTEFAKIYVRDPYRIREYLLVDEGDYVTHGIEIAQNQRTDPRSK